MMCIIALYAISVFVPACATLADSSSADCSYDEAAATLPEYGASLLQHSALSNPHEEQRLAKPAKASSKLNEEQSLAKPAKASSKLHEEQPLAKLAKVSSKASKDAKTGQTKPSKTQEESHSHISAHKHKIGLAQIAENAAPEKQSKAKVQNGKKEKTGTTLGIPNWVYGTAFAVVMCAALVLKDDNNYPNETQVSADDLRHRKPK